MKLRTLMTVALFTLVAHGAHAQGTKANDSGCGLGSMIIKENTKLMQILAATTNGSTGSQVFGITSGTSNCRAQNFVMREKAVQYFAEVNRDDLSREMAEGRGEKLETLAELYGCPAHAEPEFAKRIQHSYDKIVPTSDTPVSEMIRNLNYEISNDEKLVKTCTLI